MTTDAINALEETLPKGRVLCFDPTKHTEYTHDASSALGGPPLALVFPQSRDEVRDILLIANTYNLPVIPRAAGTGKVGGAVPLKGSLILSLEHFNALLEIDTLNHVAIVEPGLILKTLQDAVEEKNLFYPPDPASLAHCTIGGNVAVNAGGPRCLKYGVTGHYVLGLEGVWANGDLFTLGGKLQKNVTGYDLMRLLIGSEGTLGIITKITLTLLTKTRIQADCHAIFPTVQHAVNALTLIRQSGILPATAELMDSNCIQAASTYLNKPIPYPEAVHAIFQLDGHHADAVQKDSESIKHACLQTGALFCALSNQPDNDLWTIRRSISSALTAFSKNKESHDITVPVSEIAKTMTFLQSLNTTPSIIVLGYGHLGDGNLHVNILNKGLPPEAWATVKTDLEDQIFRFAVNCGGTISGEHGIGLTKKPYMHLMYSQSHLKYLKQIKSIFDPKGILNPHKII